MADAAVRQLAGALAAAVLAGCATTSSYRATGATVGAMDRAAELQRTCQYDAADSLLRQELATAPARDRAVILLSLGSIAEHRGDAAGALSRYQEAARGEAVPLEALRFLGMAQVHNRQFDEGHRNLNAFMAQNIALRKKPAWPVVAAAGLALGEMGRYDEAIELLQAALDVLDWSDPLLADLLKQARQMRASGQRPAGEFWKLAYGSSGFASSMDVNYMPQALPRVAPKYPREAARERIEGAVVMLVDVDEKGAVTNIQVRESTPPGLFDATATQAVRQWKFRPATRHCTAVPSQGLQRINFRMSR